MLTKNGPKLMDFGLAKPAPGSSSASGAGLLTPSTPTMSVAALSASASPLTQKGTVVGNVPVHGTGSLQGRESDARSDIFSFGCLLYEMFTGRRAFEGKSQFSVLGAILDKEPERISAVLPSSPPRLDETVWRCLAKNSGSALRLHARRQNPVGSFGGGRSQPAARATSLSPSPAASRLPWPSPESQCWSHSVPGQLILFQRRNPCR